MVKNVYLALFAISLVLSPIYVFDAGLPQPADFLIAFLILILATGYVVTPPVHRDLLLVAGLFLGYVAIVNLYLWSHYSSTRTLFTPLYYAYNFGSFVLVVSLLKEFRERFVLICQFALASAIVLEIIALLVLPGGTYRSLGTFNNPNQLGYWALLVGICLLVLQRDQRMSLLNLAVLCGAGYLTMASLSKGAMLAFALLLSLALVCQRLTRSTKAALLCVILAGMTLAFADTALLDRLSSEGMTGKVVHRFDSLGKQGDDSLAGRGYNRIWRYPEYLVFGAGEGADWRFAGPINARQRGMELHSTLGTVLFSYGIVGFALFLAFLAVVFRRAPLAHMLYSLPIWAYGMTHQGLRATMLWVVLGLVFGLAYYARSTSTQPMVATPAPHAPVISRAPSPSRSPGPPATDSDAIGARRTRGVVRYQPRWRAPPTA